MVPSFSLRPLSAYPKPIRVFSGVFSMEKQNVMTAVKKSKPFYGISVMTAPCTSLLLPLSRALKRHRPKAGNISRPSSQNSTKKVVLPLCSDFNGQVSPKKKEFDKSSIQRTQSPCSEKKILSPTPSKKYTEAIPPK